MKTSLFFLITMTWASFALAATNTPDIYQVETKIIHKGKIVKTVLMTTTLGKSAEVTEHSTKVDKVNRDAFEHRVHIFKENQKDKKNLLMLSSKFRYLSQTNNINMDGKTQISFTPNKDFTLFGTKDTQVVVSVNQL